MIREEKEYTKSFDLKTWKGLFPYLKPFRKRMVLLVVLNLACAAIDILLPLFQRYAIDNFIEARTIRGLLVFAGLYLFVIAFLHPLVHFLYIILLQIS